MKKLFFALLALGTLSFAACSKDDSYTPGDMPVVQPFDNETPVDTSEAPKPQKGGGTPRPAIVQSP